MRDNPAPRGPVAEMLDLLAPPARQRAACRRDIEHALANMAATKKATEHGSTQKARDAYANALDHMLAASRAYLAAGGALALRLDTLQRAISFNKQWSAHWSPLPRSAAQQQAVVLAHDLLLQWGGEIVTTKRRKWWRLAALLYGDRTHDLWRPLQAFAKSAKAETRPSRVKSNC